MNRAFRSQHHATTSAHASVHTSMHTSLGFTSPKFTSFKVELPAETLTGASFLQTYITALLAMQACETCHGLARLI